MPYRLQKSGPGWVVVNSETGRPHSKKPLSRTRAKAQMRALYANVPDARKAAAEETAGGGSRKPMTPAERARHASLVRWGKEQPFAARLEGIRQRRKAAKQKKAGGGKPKAAKPTPEQRAAEQDKAAEEARAKVFSEMGIPEDAAGALSDLMAGVDTPDDGGLVKLGLAELGKDGTLRLTSAGRALHRAATRGDLGAAKDAASRGRDKVATQAERETEKQAREQEKAEKEKSKSGGGGGKKEKKKEERKEEPSEEEEPATDEEVAAETAAEVGLDEESVDALREAADGAGAENEGLQALGLIDTNGDATPEGVDALDALERGDATGYRRATRRAKARMRREAAQGEREKEREKKKKEREEGSLRERARRTQEGDMRRLEQERKRDERSKASQDRRVAAEVGRIAAARARKAAEIKQTAQDRAMFANMGSSGGGGGGGKPTGGQGGLWKRGPDGKRTPQAGMETPKKDKDDPTDDDRALADKSRTLSKRDSDLTSEIRDLERQQEALRPSFGQTLKPKYRKEREAEHNRLQSEIDKRRAERSDVQRQSQEIHSSNAGRASMDRVVRQEILERQRKGESRPGDDVTLRGIEEGMGRRSTPSKPVELATPRAPDKGRARTSFDEYRGRQTEARQLREQARRAREDADRVEKTQPALARSLRLSAADNNQRALNLEAGPRSQELLKDIEDSGYRLNSSGRGITPNRRQSTTPRQGFNPAGYGKSLETITMSDYTPLIEDLEALKTELEELSEDDATKAGKRNAGADQALIDQGYALAEELCGLFEQLGATVEEEGEEGGEVEMLEGKAETIYGSEVKALDGDAIGGYAVLFGAEDTPDMSPHQDFFTKSTDYWLDRFGWPRPMTYHHAMDEDTKDEPIVGVWNKAVVKDEGIWLEGQLDRAHRYHGAIKELIKRGFLKLSSDSAPQWVVRERKPSGAHEVKRWPLLTASPTVTPAEPRMLGLSFKALMTELGLDDIDNPEVADTQEARPDAVKASEDDRTRRLLLLARRLQLLQE